MTDVIAQLFKYHFTVRDLANNQVIANVKATVYTAGSTTAATLYSEPTGTTAKTNPITTTVFAADDKVEFWLGAASCDVVLEHVNGQRKFLDGVTPGDHEVVMDVVEVNQNVRCSVVAEFDCGLASAAAAVVLIPAACNPRGLYITHIFGIITEAMAGDSEDQGIVTVSDESDNALATLTPTNGAADAIGDYVLGFQAASTATGTAGKVVAAGEYVDAVVTQLTAGTGLAGKMKVVIEYIQL